MLSRLIVFAIVILALCCPYVCSIDAEHRAAYERILECISKGANTDKIGCNQPFETIICDAFKEMNQCLSKPFVSTTTDSSEILDYFRAYQLQRLILIKKSKLCQKLPPHKKLKNLVNKSGLLDKGKLQGVEGDPYVPCAGEISRKCYAEAVDLWMYNSTALYIEHQFIECFEKQLTACDFPIARHIAATMEAFKKQVQKKHGIFK